LGVRLCRDVLASVPVASIAFATPHTGEVCVYAPGHAAVGRPSTRHRTNVTLFPLGTEALKDVIHCPKAEASNRN
jgi:hypothetical protein